MKAKARQQKILAQMSSNQKAFLSNPSNKMDVEAFNRNSDLQSFRPPIEIGKMWFLLQSWRKL